MVKVNCGDWHRGWGYGGHDKIGKLHKTNQGYMWEGHSQGRHGTVWNRKAWVHFSVDLETNEVGYFDSRGSFPIEKELIAGAHELEQKIKDTEAKEERAKARARKRQQIVEQKTNQLNLF